MKKLLKKPLLFLFAFAWKFMSKYFNDRLYIKIKFFWHFRKIPNLDNPKTFQEKLQWIKLNDRKEIYHQMVDKFEAKKFISEKVGEEYVIPTLGVWDSFDEIDFDKLPNQFILKCTFDSGSYYICKDKSNLDMKAIKSKLLINWGEDYSIWSKEWPYKGLKQRIIAEPLLEDPKNLKEYKFFCFNGIPKLYQSCIDRDSDLGGAILNFFDINGNILDINDAFHGRKSKEIAPIPINLLKMCQYSRILSENTYFLRVDFYEVGHKCYLGEITFFENGGWCKFIPEKYNRLLGDWIKLPID